MMDIVHWWKRSAPWILALLVVVQGVTGILLSMRYVPSERPEVDAMGRRRALAYATSLVRLHPTSRVDVVDTLATRPTFLLLALDSTDRVADLVEADARHVSIMRDAMGTPIVPSVAAASVVISISTDAPFGATIRAIHHVNTILLLAVAVLYFAALLGTVNAALPWATLLLLGLLCAAYTGKLLPDDLYANVSRSITASVLDHDVPFGGVLSTLFGVRNGTVGALTTTATMHGIVFAGCIIALVLLCLRASGQQLRSQWRLLVVVGSVLTLAAILALQPLTMDAASMPRSTNGGLQSTATITPWWPFRLPNTLIAWFGAELASYLVLGVICALLTMAWWKGSVGLWTQRIFIGLVLAILVIGSIL